MNDPILIAHRESLGRRDVAGWKDYRRAGTSDPDGSVIDSGQTKGHFST